jgi:ATP-dependent Lhr-like helicase
VSLSGEDPLNLLGIVTRGPRLPSLTGNRLLYRDGLPIATFAAGEVSFLETLDPKKQWEARNSLLRRQVRLLPAAAQSLDEGDAGLEAV